MEFGVEGYAFAVFAETRRRPVAGEEDLLPRLLPAHVLVGVVEIDEVQPDTPARPAPVGFGPVACGVPKQKNTTPPASSSQCTARSRPSAM